MQTTHLRSTPVEMSGDHSRPGPDVSINRPIRWLALAVIGMLLLVGNAVAQTQLGADIDGEAAGDRFGWSVALSSDGSRVAIGGRLNDGAATIAGHVRVFEWSGGAWSWQALPPPSSCCGAKSAR